MKYSRVLISLLFQVGPGDDPGAVLAISTRYVLGPAFTPVKLSKAVAAFGTGGSTWPS